jgi:hypothetical protein
MNAAAVEESGIQMMPKNPDWNAYDRFPMDATGNFVAQKAFDDKCPNLRLDKRMGSNVAGVPKGYGLCCLHGEGHKCTCMSKYKKLQAQEDPSTIEKLKTQAEVRQAKLDARQIVAMAITDQNTEILRMILGKMNYGQANSAKDRQLFAEDILLMIAEEIIGSWGGWESSEDPALTKKNIKNNLEVAGLESPWKEIGMTRAEKAMDEFTHWILPFINDEDLDVERMEEMMNQIGAIENEPGLDYETQKQPMWAAKSTLRNRVQKAKQTLVYAFRNDQ